MKIVIPSALLLAGSIAFVQELISQVEASRRYVAMLPNGANVTGYRAIGHPDGTGRSAAVNNFGARRPVLPVEQDVKSCGALDDRCLAPRQCVAGLGLKVVGERGVQHIDRCADHRPERDYPPQYDESTHHHDCSYNDKPTSYDQSPSDYQSSNDYESSDYDQSSGNDQSPSDYESPSDYQSSGDDHTSGDNQSPCYDASPDDHKSSGDNESSGNDQSAGDYDSSGNDKPSGDY
ncbi:uncharacterized protein KRP23_10493 [Phytophthora ramorum]|uniref:uncharacterized protein n=1 Tax=Phytophthora ramorum TaxID=164328 RepID=UPI0030B143D5|nr:hypothetical protein KRP23_10493 [Phytophthora ramorum]